MKILVISNLYPPFYLGGYELLCEQVCNNLEQRGHFIKVLTTTHGTTSPGQDEGIVFRKLRLYCPFEKKAGIMRNKRKATSYINYHLTKKKIDDDNPDLIFIWSQLRLTLGPAKAAEESGKPVVYTFNDEHIAGYAPAVFHLKPKKLASFILDSTLFSGITFKGLKFSHTTCISQTLKNNLIAQGVPVSEAQVIYQGIPVEKFPLKSPSAVPGDPLKLLYVGQLHRYKGVHTFIKAGNILSEKTDRKIICTVIGEGDKEYLKELKTLGEKERVTFMGKISHDQLPQFYREHDVFVFPSLWQEPFGLTHLEAMASGLPVVSTADGGHGEFLVDRKNSLIFQKENHNALASAISRLVEDDELRLKLVREAREMVEKDFSMTRYVDELEQFLLKAL